MTRALGCLLLLLVSASPSRPQTEISAPDSAEAPAPPDSLRRRLSPPGTIDRCLDSARIIARSRFPLLAYRYAGDLLAAHPGVFIAEQSGEGQYSPLSIRGERAIGFMADGRPIDDPAFGFNLYRYPVEAAERIEIITGPRSCVYGRNTTGGAVNFVSRHEDSNRPLSVLAYSEGGGNSSRTDGMFSQNISRSLNLAAGFQAQATDGLYPNGTSEQWNARSRLTFRPRGDLTVVAAHHYVDARTGLHGGVDLPATGIARSFNPLLAVMANTDAYEKVSRHDADLSFSAAFLADTASVTSLQLFYSRQFREYRDEENRRAPNGVFIQSDHTTSRTGAVARQALVSSWQCLQAGASVDLLQVEGSPGIGRRRNVAGGAWVIEELRIAENLRTAVFGRIDGFRGKVYAAGGADLRAEAAPGVTVTAGFALARRIPSYVELFWSGDSVTREEPVRAERHRTAEAGVLLRLPDLGSVRVTLFHRMVEDPVLITSGAGLTPRPPLRFANGPARRTSGVEAEGEARFWVFSVDAVAAFLEQRDAQRGLLSEYPRWTAAGGLYYRSALLGGSLDLKAGFRGRYQAGYAGSLFRSEALVFTPNGVFDPGGGSSIDFQLFGRIGDAWIHFLWMNLTDAKYFASPFYPVRGREITFGITWQFLD